ncbi:MULTISPECIES: GNAT family N-acetyltransferase [Acidiphilium]|uniref:Protein N-acetyltransferase, RimJ/RimL family n=1 Tax=Acidiphilium rubrum TaxID=526 RepID=A0A8G2CKR1_ACIRU|nr:MULTISPECIES: GNAT family N-acetyltransferase [Acidiphilium]SIQ83377.1 Protein N-acetyltransferase, RimJ/RimL family [Acidiphilium rubrum]
MTNPTWRVTTARLRLDPVSWADLADLVALKTDPRAFALMLGGVRTRERAAEELAEDIGLWGRHGYGIWTVRGLNTGNFIGMTGLAARPDGRGIALRFALWPEVRGAGLAREAGGAALRYGHDQARLPRIVAVARADNFASRTVLGAIGMVEVEGFVRDDVPMLLYQSVIRRDGR